MYHKGLALPGKMTSSSGLCFYRENGSSLVLSIVAWVTSQSAEVCAQLERMTEVERVGGCLSGRFPADRLSGALPTSVSPGTELLSLWVIGFLLPSRTGFGNL